jgi:hypothetical protein
MLMNITINKTKKRIIILLLFIILIIILLFIKFSKQHFSNKKKENDKSKIIVCLFGVIPRSIKYTWKTIQQNIIKPLQKEYIVDIYIFNLDVEENKVDGVKLNQKDIDIIPYDYKEVEKQSEIDKDISETVKKYKFRSDYSHYTSMNACRQLYSEYRFGKFLEKNKNKYEGAIVCGPDFYIINKLNLNDFKDSLKNKNIYTTDTNDAQGYTNGFYFGKPEVLVKILNRYTYFYTFPENKDYEFLLKQSFIKHNIKRIVTDMIFFKIRANKNVVWQVDMRYKKNNHDNIPFINNKKNDIQKKIKN